MNAWLFVGGWMAAASVLLAGSIPAEAQEKEQPFKDLIASGYVVQASTYIPVTPDVDKPTIVITLQSGKSVAVCTFGIPEWENMTSTMESSSTACDVRSY